jgi:glucose/mannose-6-phosphate isomerase
MDDLRKQLDPSDMLGRVLAFPSQMETAWEIGNAFVKTATLSSGPFTRVVVCGMGGSAIGGDLARSFLGERASVPIVVWRDYGLPVNLARGALVIVSSYSGNTGETLAGYDAARREAKAIVAVTSGGELAKHCVRDGVPFCTIPGGMPPRSAIAFSFFPMLLILRASGVAEFAADEYTEAVSIATERRDTYAPSRPGNTAIELARAIHGNTGFIYASPLLLEGVARRWACQFNENAKTIAHVATFPELDHNEIVGWAVAPHLIPHSVVVSLEDRDDHEWTRRQVDISLSIIGEHAARVVRLEAPGGGRLARMLAMMQLGDFTSVYLAYLNGVDPTPVTTIDRLKKALADQTGSHS